MNRPQRVILLIGLVGIALAGMFPPWVTFTITNSNPAVMAPAGLHFILRPPPSWEEFSCSFTPGAPSSHTKQTARIDTARLAIEWAVIAAAFSIALLVERIRARHR